jgi:nitronate monooxygenase
VKPKCSSPTRLPRRLKLPLIAEPMFLVSGVELVVAACREGVRRRLPNCKLPERR